ncbi:MAG: glycosyltransferase family 2 protein [Chthoniobacterales bacterium]
MASQLPIAMVTPSYNQATYLEAALQSVLSQDYSPLQYVVMDGGSTDGSAEIIERYRNRFHHVSFGPDGGQYQAISSGFAKTDAPIMGWLNSDDLHTPWTLSIVGEIFANVPEVQWLTTLFPLRWDAAGRAVSCREQKGFSKEGFLRGYYLPGSRGFFGGMIQQESTFWRRSLWEKCGAAFDANFSDAGDFDLWMRFSKETPLYGIATSLAGFRMHGEQKTSQLLKEYQKQAENSWRQHGGSYASVPTPVENALRDRLPTGLQPMANSLGLLHPAKVIRRSRDNTKWNVEDVMV